MDLNRFLDDGTANILRIASRYYLHDAAGIAWLAKIATSVRKAGKRRRAHEEAGTHIPMFLIASIASECNLNCTGCYARANGTVGPEAKTAELSADTWACIFDEASELGICYILLAGGEPLMRPDVVKLAATHAEMIFPIFTNGLLIDDGWLAFFETHRNMIPLFSLEGDLGQTDARRGAGVADRIHAAMEEFRKKHVLWGTSLTVTRGNLETVTSADYADELYRRGCGVIVMNEYVPFACGTESLALTMADHDLLMTRVDALKASGNYDGMNIICFPGNEEYMGGCLAAGRGFFHISSAGAAEPCPFSPFSVANVADVGLLGALQSDFFAKVRAIEAAHADEHMGGCTLFLHEDEVIRALQ